MAIRRFLVTIDSNKEVHSKLLCAALQKYIQDGLFIRSVEVKTVLKKELIRNHGLFNLDKVEDEQQENSDTRNNRGVRNRGSKRDNSKTLRGGGPGDTAT